jgi:hypothetical protein
LLLSGLTRPTPFATASKEPPRALPRAWPRAVRARSTLAFSTVDEPVKKVAIVLTIADELLEDAPAIRQFVNSQLSAFVRIESERSCCAVPRALTRSRAC